MDNSAVLTAKEEYYRFYSLAPGKPCLSHPVRLWLFLKQFRCEFVPLFHGVQGRFAAQS
jgi:hypothetical protein